MIGTRGKTHSYQIGRGKNPVDPHSCSFEINGHLGDTDLTPFSKTAANPSSPYSSSSSTVMVGLDLGLTWTTREPMIRQLTECLIDDTSSDGRESPECEAPAHMRWPCTSLCLWICKLEPGVVRFSIAQPQET
ncbi:hypothetical protein SUGI_1150960 [Cryptomeria japonica]|nr:hypothetical protein SUGI_1150960 [Cryptomeria japonica]